MTPAIAIHLFAAVPAVAVGAGVLTLRKGTAIHKLAGRVWVGLMLVTAASSFWITELNPGRFSWIHLLSVWVLISLAMAVYTIRWRRDRRAHRIWMIGTFVGLVGAGSFAFLPNRLLGGLIFG